MTDAMKTALYGSATDAEIIVLNFQVATFGAIIGITLMLCGIMGICALAKARRNSYPRRNRGKGWL